MLSQEFRLLGEGETDEAENSNEISITTSIKIALRLLTAPNCDQNEAQALNLVCL